MGVYIENIHMPEDGEHPLWISLHSDGTVEYNANKGDGWQMTTAVPVSSHGRLIDADALESLFWDGQCYFTDNIKYKIKNIETIIPAEEGE